MSATHMDIAAFLQQVPPFDRVSARSLEALAPHARLVRFRRNEQIVRAGDPGETMFIVVDGMVRVTATDAAGRERHLSWLGPREMFGEMALVTGDRRTADVVADERTTCIAVDRLPFYALLKQNRPAASFLTELVGRRLLDGGHVQHVGKYQVLHQIGRGGMGTVFAGYHAKLHRPVALKMLNHEMVFDDEFAARFAAEAAIVARLHHPNIVQVFDHESAYATQFIVMELLHGETLGDLMRRERQLEEGFVRRVLRQLAEALAHAHARDITHRDVKPENVMLPADGPLKLMDFGIAGPIGGHDVDQPVGTPGYMSPEQARGLEIDERTDIYPLGVMAYEMLTGDLPFHDDDFDTLLELKERAPLPSVRAWRPEVSDSMVRFIERACAPDPADRFTTCAEVLEHLGGAAPARLHAGLRSRNVTLLYEAGAEDAVRNAVDRLAASLHGEPVVVSVAAHHDLKHLLGH